jgi:hypothetical protein
MIRGENFVILNKDSKNLKYFKCPLSLSTVHTVYGILSEDKIEKVNINNEPFSRIAVLANNLIYDYLPKKNLKAQFKKEFYVNYHVVLNALQRLRTNYLINNNLETTQVIQREYENVEISRDLLDGLKKLSELADKDLRDYLVQCVDESFREFSKLSRSYPLYALRNVKNHAKLLKDGGLKKVKISNSEEFDFRYKIFEPIQETTNSLVLRYYSPSNTLVLSAGRKTLEIKKEFLFKGISEYRRVLRRLERKIIAKNIILTELITNQYHLSEDGKYKSIKIDAIHEISSTAYLLLIHGIIGVPIYKYENS